MTASWKHYLSLQKTTLARPIKKGLDAAKRSKIESKTKLFTFELYMYILIMSPESLW